MINKIAEYAALYDKLGLGSQTGGTNSMGWVLPAQGFDRNAARAQWATNQARGNPELPNFFAGQGQGQPMPQFNSPMPDNPYTARVNQQGTGDPLNGDVRNYLAQLFRKPNNSTVGIRG